MWFWWSNHGLDLLYSTTTWLADHNTTIITVKIPRSVITIAITPSLPAQCKPITVQKLMFKYEWCDHHFTYRLWINPDYSTMLFAEEWASVEIPAGFNFFIGHVSYDYKTVHDCVTKQILEIWFLDFNLLRTCMVKFVLVQQLHYSRTAILVHAQCTVISTTVLKIKSVPYCKIWFCFYCIFREWHQNMSDTASAKPKHLL